MKIAFVEIQNFRKLKSVRIDFSKTTTVFVGANNSGKTSAMVALSHFLIDKSSFTVDDFTLSSWPSIGQIANRWEESGLLENWESAELDAWASILPTIDVWLDVNPGEAYLVQHLLPSMEWTSGLIGIRLRLQPKYFPDLYKAYTDARKSSKEIIAEAKKNRVTAQNHEDYTVSLWPKDICEFLERKMSMFKIVAYNLDAGLIEEPINGIAKPQKLRDDSIEIEEDPFKGLIRIDRIDAHRGFSNLNTKSIDENGNEISYGDKGKLSEQLRTYYGKHIDPLQTPDAKDVEALEAIYKAQKEFDERLKAGFKSRFDELQDLGYPGVTDPTLQVSTKIKPVDGLKHPSALKYVIPFQGKDTEPLQSTLPEHYNGLGYQNLISMVFKLMSFRDAWMLVGKAKNASSQSSVDSIPPLHLVLVEEPEAHLHVQVQQVFIRKAYDILRKHDLLQASPTLSTQLVVSTHSSHIAHECEFAQLRYFRRKPPEENHEVPISAVINLSEVFGEIDDKVAENDKTSNIDKTAKFVSKYIKAIHCELFFADGVVIVEGSAERMLIPHFIREYYPSLHHSYITLLEIGGSHAHRLKGLLDHLGLVTLIITDLDAASHEGRHPSVQPRIGKKQITRNNTLKSWVPSKANVDDLLALTSEQKEKQTDKYYAVKACYQIEVHVKLISTGSEESAIPSTFEDAFVLENIEFIKAMTGEGLVEDFKECITNAKTVAELTTGLYEIIRENGKGKAEFALNVLYFDSTLPIIAPTYIKQGLDWLQQRIKIKQEDALITPPVAEMVQAATEQQPNLEEKDGK